MARLEFFVVSRGISIDQHTNSVSIFEIMEEIHALSFPAHVSCIAMSLWQREADDDGQDFQLLLGITTPGGSHYEVCSNFRFTAARHRVIQRLEGLPLEKEGTVRFEAILNGKHAAEHIADVHLTAPVDATGSLPDSA